MGEGGEVSLAEVDERGWQAGGGFSERGGL